MFDDTVQVRIIVQHISEAEQKSADSDLHQERSFSIPENRAVGIKSPSELKRMTRILFGCSTRMFQNVRSFTGFALQPVWLK